MSESGVIPPPEDRPQVREVGRTRSRYAQPIIFGINGDAVTLRIGPNCVHLGPAEREEFSRLYFEAERQAEASDG